jgi:hypothetical protein
MRKSTERANVIDLRPVWRCADASVERDVLVFWREHRLLPQRADAGRRLKDLCVVAYLGPRVVGSLSTPLARIEFLRARLAMIRLAAPAERRGASLATRLLPARLLLKGQRLLAEWSLANPSERVMGLGAIVPPGTYGRKMKQAVWQPFGLVLANHTPRGEQFRVAWFAHATVE